MDEETLAYIIAIEEKLCFAQETARYLEDLLKIVSTGIATLEEEGEMRSRIRQVMLS